MKGLLLLALSLTLVSCGGTGDTFVVKGAHVLPGTSSSLEAGTPTAMFIKVKRLWLLPAASCAPAAGKVLADYLVENRSDFAEFDMVSAPTLFSGAPAAGTYNCMILELSDIIKFRPDRVAQDAHTVAKCNVELDYYFDIFTESQPYWYNPVTDTDDTATGVDQYATETDYASNYQAVYQFATTDADAVTALHPNAQAMVLTAPIVLSGEAVDVNFILDTRDKITAGYSTVDTCSLEQPTITVTE